MEVENERGVNKRNHSTWRQSYYSIYFTFEELKSELESLKSKRITA